MIDIISRLESAPHDSLARAALDEIGRLGEALARERAGRLLAEGERDELIAWQEKVCAIIQPAENADEWGADVSDIIAMREKQRLAARCWARRWKGKAKSYRKMYRVAMGGLFNCAKKRRELEADPSSSRRGGG